MSLLVQCVATQQLNAPPSPYDGRYTVAQRAQPHRRIFTKHVRAEYHSILYTMTGGGSMKAAAILRAATTRVGARCLHQTPPAFNVKAETLSPLYTFGGVHGSRSGQKTWRNKPLFRREVMYNASPGVIGAYKQSHMYPYNNIYTRMSCDECSIARNTMLRT